MKKAIAIILCIIMVLATAACGSKAPAAEPTAAEAPAAKPIEIKLTTTDPTGCPTVNALEACAKEIYDRTNGMVDIQVYADGQMLVYAEGVEAMMSNANLILVATPSYLVDYVPVLSTLVSPYLFSSREVAAAFFDSDYFQGIRQECIDAGFYCLCSDGLIGYRSVYASQPVHSVDDLRKLSLRISSGDVFVKLFSDMGCNYTVISFSDVFNALQTGAIDGLECVPLTVTANSLYDAKSPMYYSTTNHILDCYGMWVGYEFWSSIPEEYRSIIDEVLGNWGKVATAACVEQEENVIYPAYEEHGVTVVDLTDEERADFRVYGEEVIRQQVRGDEVLAAVKAVEESLG